MSAVDTAITRLATAAIERRPCEPVRDVLPVGDVETAYAVQSALIARRTAAGARNVGRKIGLTNPKVQAQLGVDQPDFGVLLDDMACPQDQAVDITRLLQPKIEAEIAFVLDADLDSESITDADVAAATGYVVAALEIVDSRIDGWDISIVDTIADNASSGLFVLGDQHVSLDGLDLAAASMTMDKDGQPATTGTGADCLGSPLTAVAWLANTARAYGAPLRAGDIILSGALGPMVTVEPDSTFTADITGIGAVTVAFSRP
ncbi:2-keto-4-pentenoate hydratase [Micromonospora inositola]|uniref:2-keto-4-pentenoate hydratase n=1 Tax=Micromonospora inositola TaxID=47865 RepID=A0A1C5K5W5_9ACTN|nr:fumarylacetoacetate hydrolase family protein [Micromonospora inositola]SCG77991.1 2-keto-4-pentenoate hydratase [Micromonospora inositola]